MNINNENVTFVVQGPVIPDLTGRCLASIKELFPGSEIIVSTWDNTDTTSLSEFGCKYVFSKDPGFKPRGEHVDSKPNNVNRQIISSIKGLKQVHSEYALKMRTDFLITGRGFIDNFDNYRKYDKAYKIFQKRLMVCMFGTRRPMGRYYNLPYHISDFASFGLTNDLINLYDIPLVSDYEFDYFKFNKHIKPETFAINRYNAEQSIIIKFLKKNNKKVLCKYSTNVNHQIIEDSNKILVNNFQPMSFQKYGIYPIKEHLLPQNNVMFYTDYYTEREWLVLYKQFCDTSITLSPEDAERAFIEKTQLALEGIDRILSFFKWMPFSIKKKLFSKKYSRKEILQKKFGEHF